MRTNAVATVYFNKKKWEKKLPTDATIELHQADIMGVIKRRLALGWSNLEIEREIAKCGWDLDEKEIQIGERSFTYGQPKIWDGEKWVPDVNTPAQPDPYEATIIGAWPLVSGRISVDFKWGKNTLTDTVPGKSEPKVGDKVILNGQGSVVMLRGQDLARWR